LKSFVIFKDTVVFDKNKIWDIKDVKRKCPKTEVEPIFPAYVDVVFGGKKLQKGVMILAEDEHDAIQRLDKWRKLTKEYS